MIKVYSCTETGGHANNEDAFGLRSHGQDDERMLCVLADGQGGRAGGAQAAAIACKTFLDLAECFSPTELLNATTWITALESVDEVVAADPKAGFSTIIAFCVTKDSLCGASCGDSAVLLLNPDEPAQVLSKRQYKDPPVGSRTASFVPFTAKLVCPWVVLAMSDGVWKYAGWDNIVKISAEAPPEEIIPQIRSRAQLRNGSLQDDFTLVVLQLVGN
jgi:serine/threonine protein phosphatase PrpC